MNYNTVYDDIMATFPRQRAIRKGIMENTFELMPGRLQEVTAGYNQTIQINVQIIQEVLDKMSDKWAFTTTYLKIKEAKREYVQLLIFPENMKEE